MPIWIFRSSCLYSVLKPLLNRLVESRALIGYTKTRASRVTAARDQAMIGIHLGREFGRLAKGLPVKTGGGSATPGRKSRDPAGDGVPANTYP
jgi:hypothetical protein